MSYLADFFVRMKRRSNYPVLIYMLLNTYIIGEILSGLFSMPFWKAYLMGLVIYGISLMLALSPLGEWFLRWEAGCKKIKRKEYIDRLEPLFYSVYEKARKQDPSIPEDVQFYMSEDPSANAFATGRKTVCVTKGLLGLNDAQIKGILGHEFGHLAHKDTDKILLVYVGNLIFNAIIMIINFIVLFMMAFGVGMVVRSEKISGLITHFLYTITVGFLLWIWAKVGLWLTMKTSRNNEFEADEFSFELGYGVGLCSGLDAITGGEAPAKGVFASLAASHPDTDDRIARLQSLGCNYYRGR